MAVLDHDHLPDAAKHAGPGGLLATCNLCLVFIALIGLAYAFSLFI
jgi:hypothetical protein